MATLIGYARVSTHDQDLDVQTSALKAAGCAIIRSEKVSGASRDNRTELQTVLEFLRPGDVLTVVRLDRLGRDTRDVLNIVHEIEQRGASLKVLSPAIDTSGDMGKIVLTVLGMVGQMERTFIKERQRAGIEAAKIKGVYKGGKAKINPEQVRELTSQGLGPTEIGRRLGVTRQAVHKATKHGTAPA
jgi:DNA invertase Pin-like site-specific DNA recombinase